MSERLMIHRPRPIDEARTYLRMRGVDYNDLITGDHAAALLVEWTKAMTDRYEHGMRLLAEQEFYKLNTQLHEVITDKEM